MKKIIAGLIIFIFVSLIANGVEPVAFSVVTKKTENVKDKGTGDLGTRPVKKLLPTQEFFNAVREETPPLLLTATATAGQEEAFSPSFIHPSL